MCTKVHRKEVKFKEVVRLRDLYTPLTERAGSWASRDDKSRESNLEKYMGELMEGKGYFRGVLTPLSPVI